MTKKEKFIELVEILMDGVEIDSDYNDALDYFEAFKAIEEKEKPIMTEKGAAIIKFLQENIEDYSKPFPAKKVAEGMGIPARSTSASMRALISSGFLDKNGDKPIIYTITEKGKNFQFED